MGMKEHKKWRAYDLLLNDVRIKDREVPWKEISCLMRFKKMVKQT